MDRRPQRPRRRDRCLGGHRGGAVRLPARPRRNRPACRDDRLPREEGDGRRHVPRPDVERAAPRFPARESGLVHPRRAPRAGHRPRGPGRAAGPAGRGPRRQRRGLPAFAMSTSPPIRRGFKPLPAHRRLAFIMLVLGGLYLIFDVYMFFSRGLFMFIGVDYRSFWASAMIAHTHGFAQVYNLDLQAQLQEPLVQTFANPARELKWSTIPTPYPPAFVLPFELFLPFS